MAGIVHSRQIHSPVRWSPRNLIKGKYIGLAIVLLLYITGVEKLNNYVKIVSHDYFGSSDRKLAQDISQWHPPAVERIHSLSNRKPDTEIRYAAFGSSMTWGSNLDDREKDAYVKILSNRGTNYGIRAGDPNYPAACTNSMIDIEEYDVIILEFFHTSNNGLFELAMRLRERFPDAIIIIARFWAPSMLKNKDSNLKAWAKERGFDKGFVHDSMFKKAFLRDFNENQWHWVFESDSNTYVDTQEFVARETGAYIIPMAWSRDATGENGYLEIGDKMFGNDSRHFSELGHVDFARRVKALVDRVGVPKQPKIGEFSTVDYCLNWFQTGVIKEWLKHSENAVVGKMPNTDKYAMSFERKEMHPDWIEIRNPSDYVMFIYVAYMTTGPAPSKYPKTEATREDGEGTKVLIDPLSEKYNFEVHVSQMVCLGKVQPKKTAKISFKPLTESEWPFRLVQVVLTGRADFGDFSRSMPDSERVNGVSEPS